METQSILHRMLLECYLNWIMRIRINKFLHWRNALQFSIPAVGAGFTVLMVIIPLATLVMFSFREGTPWEPGPFTFENYITAYSDPQTYTMFWNTVFIALASTSISMVIAAFFAFLTERTDLPFRNLAWGLMLIPMAIPGLLFAVSWTFLLSPEIGLFNVILRNFLSLMGYNITSGPFNIYSLWGIIMLEGLRGSTTTFLIMVGAFRAMDQSFEEAARTSGASNKTTVLRVSLPMLTPALLGAGTYSFMTHLESLEIPLVIGLPAKIFVFPSYIFFTTQRFSPPEFGLSAALGATFILVSILLVYFYRRVVSQTGRYATVTGRGYRPGLIHLGKWRYFCFFVFLVFFILSIGGPCFILLWTSLLPNYHTPSWDLLSSLSFSQYQELFERDDLVDATKNTIYVTLIAATLTMVLSLTVAWIINRRQHVGRGVLDAITFLPHALPGVVIAIAITFVFVLPPLNKLGLFGSIWVLALGLTVSYIAFGSRTMIGAFAQLHEELEEAGRTSGAKWSVIIRRIILPLLLPSFISGWIWVASHALRNFSISLMLSSRESEVLPVLMWNTWDDGYPGITSALGILLILFLAVLTITGRLLVVRLSRQQET